MEIVIISAVITVLVIAGAAAAEKELETGNKEAGAK